MSRSRAEKWMNEGEVELHDDTIFTEPPEATAEDKTIVTLYLRIPLPLKEKFDSAAKALDQSANAWAKDCLSRCVRESEVAA